MLASLPWSRSEPTRRLYEETQAVRHVKRWFALDVDELGERRVRKVLGAFCVESRNGTMIILEGTSDLPFGRRLIAKVHAPGKNARERLSPSRIGFIRVLCRPS